MNFVDRIEPAIYHALMVTSVIEATPTRASGSEASQSSNRSADSSTWGSGLLLVIVVVLSAGVGYALGDAGDVFGRSSATNFTTATIRDERGNLGLYLPQPEISPSQVVQIQLDALARFRFDPTAAEQVFVFASPANRAATGPLDTFAAMLSLRPYEALVNRSGCSLGREVRKGRIATVLVTTVDQAGRISLFRFLLGRRQIEGGEGDVRDCWVTDAVECLAWRVELAESPETPPIDDLSI